MLVLHELAPPNAAVAEIVDVIDLAPLPSRRSTSVCTARISSLRLREQCPAVSSRRMFILDAADSRRVVALCIEEQQVNIASAVSSVSGSPGH